MHIKKGEQSVFTLLGDWMRDEAMFNLISKIKFFRTYLIGRCFRRWHKVHTCFDLAAYVCYADLSATLYHDPIRHDCNLVHLAVTKQ